MLNMVMIAPSSVLSLLPSTASPLYSTVAGITLSIAGALLCILATFLSAKILSNPHGFTLQNSSNNSNPFDNISSTAWFLSIATIGVVFCTLVQVSLHAVAEVLDHSEYLRHIVLWNTVFFSSDLASIWLATAYQCRILQQSLVRQTSEDAPELPSRTIGTIAFSVHEEQQPPHEAPEGWVFKTTFSRGSIAQH